MIAGGYKEITFEGLYFCKLFAGFPDADKGFLGDIFGQRVQFHQLLHKERYPPVVSVVQDGKGFFISFYKAVEQLPVLII